MSQAQLIQHIQRAGQAGEAVVQHMVVGGGQQIKTSILQGLGKGVRCFEKGKAAEIVQAAALSQRRFQVAQRIVSLGKIGLHKTKKAGKIKASALSVIAGLKIFQMAHQGRRCWRLQQYGFPVQPALSWCLPSSQRGSPPWFGQCRWGRPR